MGIVLDHPTKHYLRQMGLNYLESIKSYFLCKVHKQGLGYREYYFLKEVRFAIMSLGQKIDLNYSHGEYVFQINLSRYLSQEFL